MSITNKQDSASSANINDHWQQGAVVYQVYPRSFQDSNGDGVGDIAGITSRLPHLKELGVTTVWLSPFYPSPMADFGYDIADYRGVDPLFGTLDDVKALLQRAAELNLKVLFDLVPNHTSDDHEWFKTSRTSRNNPYADWYVWRDPHPSSEPDRPSPPNNWRDVFSGGSAWEWVPERQQFYLHSFHTKQPDLNWSNRAVHDAIKDVMRFWLGLGVNGFRVDAVYWMGKDPLLHDDASNPDYIEGEDHLYNSLQHNHSQGWPSVYAYLSEIAEVLKEPAYQDKPRFMITEAYPERHNPIGDYLTLYASMDPAVAAPFNFEGISLEWNAHAWHRFLHSFHDNLAQFGPSCVVSYAFGNHDQPRLVTRIGEAAARSAAVLQMTLPGMAFIYYGEEIGMHDVAIPPELVKDPASVGTRGTASVGRDPARTPMQWTAEPSAGFSQADSLWLPLADDFRIRNVVSQQSDPDSFLMLYQTLGRLRSDTPAISKGSITVLEPVHQDVLMFTRQLTGHTTYLTLVNFANNEVWIELPQQIESLIVSSDCRTTAADWRSGQETVLRPNEAVLLSLRDY